jgi:hypothetical protein
MAIHSFPEDDTDVALGFSNDTQYIGIFVCED